MATSTKVVVFFLLLASIVATGTQADVSCETVAENIYPCVPYVVAGGVGPVPDSCCNGVKMLKEVAKSVSDREDVCECINYSFVEGPPDSFKIISTLPEKCFADGRFLECNDD